MEEPRDRSPSSAPFDVCVVRSQRHCLEGLVDRRLWNRRTRPQPFCGRASIRFFYDRTVQAQNAAVPCKNDSRILEPAMHKHDGFDVPDSGYRGRPFRLPLFAADRLRTSLAVLFPDDRLTRSSRAGRSEVPARPRMGGAASSLIAAAAPCVASAATDVTSRKIFSFCAAAWIFGNSLLKAARLLPMKSVSSVWPTRMHPSVSASVLPGWMRTPVKLGTS